jgi:hypothetical protein
VGIVKHDRQSALGGLANLLLNPVVNLNPVSLYCGIAVQLLPDVVAVHYKRAFVMLKHAGKSGLAGSRSTNKDKRFHFRHSALLLA